MISRYSRPEMEAIWSEDSKFDLWLEVELLAMEAMAEEGIIPKDVPSRARRNAAYDSKKIPEIEKEVKHDVIAFLTEVGASLGEDSRFLHFGMTSSDLIDTAFSVQLIRATDLILLAVDRLLGGLKKRAMETKNFLCIGRSHGIHAEPTTFGLKLAGFYAEISRARDRIKNAKEEMSVGAISGPVGTYSQLPPSVEKYVCAKLGLKPVPVSTQVIPRDIHAGLFTSFSLLASSIERLAIEIRHLQRTEVREAEELFSKGQKGSSAMPHKRNPILSENISGLCRLVRSLSSSSLENIALWHERDISHSSVERVIAPDITIALDFLTHRAASLIEGLVVYEARLKKNLNLTGGLFFSATLLLYLTDKGLTREDAYDLVQRNAMKVWESVDSDSPLIFREEVDLDEKITSLLTKEELDEVFSYERFTKHLDFIFDRVFLGE